MKRLLIVLFTIVLICLVHRVDLHRLSELKRPFFAWSELGASLDFDRRFVTPYARYSVTPGMVHVSHDAEDGGGYRESGENPRIRTTWNVPVLISVSLVFLCVLYIDKLFVRIPKKSGLEE